MTKNKITPPAGMSAAAKKHFEKIVADVPGRWLPHHADALEAYCNTVDIARKLKKQLDKMPNAKKLIERSDGQQQVSPLFAVHEKYSTAAHNMRKELGLNPVSEAKSSLDMPDNVGDDPFAAHRTPKGLG